MADTFTIPCNEISTLDACIQIEETCALIYYAFARIFANSPKIHSLWTAMAMEEERHADEFRATQAIHCKNHTCSDIENNLIKVTLEQIQSLYDDINKKSPSLREALLTAMILEKSVEKYHLEASKQVLDPELARLLDVMMEYSHGHAETLRLVADSIEMSR